MSNKFLFTFRYVFKSKKLDGLGFKVVTGLLHEHEELMKSILDDPDILSCIREYVCSYECNRVGMVDTVKKENSSAEV